MLKLKLQYFGHRMWRADSFEKIPMLGKMKAGGEGDNSRWDGWMVSPTQWTWVWANSGSWWMTGKPGMLQSMGLQRVGHDCLNWPSLIPFWLKFTLFFATSQTPISWKPYVGKNLILEAETPDFKFQLHNQVTKTFWTYVSPWVKSGLWHLYPKVTQYIKWDNTCESVYCVQDFFYLLCRFTTRFKGEALSRGS